MPDQDPSSLPPDFGARIRAAAAYANLSLERFAEKLGIAGASYSTLRKYVEQEKRPPPLARDELVRRLAEASGLPASFFLGRDPEEPTLASIHDLLEAMRFESATRDLEVIRRLDEGLPPNTASR